jgi:hypothetical protein
MVVFEHIAHHTQIHFLAIELIAHRIQELELILLLILLASLVLDRIPVREHTQPAMFSIMVVLLGVPSLVREHTRIAMYRHQHRLLATLQVREHTRLAIPALEHILAPMQTHLLVRELTQETIPVLEHIPVRILVHMRVIQF